MLRYFPNKSEAAARDASQCELVDEQMRAVSQAKENTHAWARGAEWMRDGLHEVLFRVEALPKSGRLGLGLVSTGFTLENQKGGLGESSENAWGFEFTTNGVRVLEQGKEVFRKLDASCALRRKAVILCTIEMMGGGARTICCAVNNKDIGYSLKDATGTACDGHSDRLALAISMSGAPAGEAQYDVHCLEYSVTWEATMGRLDTIGRAEKAMDEVANMFRDMMKKDTDPDANTPQSADHIGKATAACNDVQSLLRQVAKDSGQKKSPREEPTLMQYASNPTLPANHRSPPPHITTPLPDSESPFSIPQEESGESPGTISLSDGHHSPSPRNLDNSSSPTTMRDEEKCVEMVDEPFSPKSPRQLAQELAARRSLRHSPANRSPPVPNIKSDSTCILPSSSSPYRIVLTPTSSPDAKRWSGPTASALPDDSPRCLSPDQLPKFRSNMQKFPGLSLRAPSLPSAITTQGPDEEYLDETHLTLAANWLTTPRTPMNRETMLSPRQRGLADLLEKCHLSSYMKSLRRSGYVELGDIREADEADLLEIGLKKPEAKRLRRYLREQTD